MSNAYDRKLRDLAKSMAKEMGFESFTREGVYSMMVGPNFETVTEAKFLHLIGVDATGESCGVCGCSNHTHTHTYTRTERERESERTYMT